ncbi:MAG: hypothetical protein R3D67_14210 [Hyphomicrobiaceae bacterium]
MPARRSPPVGRRSYRLRVLTAETQPKLEARLRELKAKRGWSGADAEDKVAALVSDAKTLELDGKAAGLLSVDRRAERESGSGTTIDSLHDQCLAGYATIELQATVKAKSNHLLPASTRNWRVLRRTRLPPPRRQRKPEGTATANADAGAKPPREAQPPEAKAKNPRPAHAAKAGSRAGPVSRPAQKSSAISAPAKPKTPTPPRAAAALPAKPASPKAALAWAPAKAQIQQDAMPAPAPPSAPLPSNRDPAERWVFR